MTLIKRDFYSADPSIAQVRWKDTVGYARRVKNGEDWHDVKVEQPFAIDVWRAMVGYEYFTDGGRKTELVPVNMDMPKKKEKGREIYSLVIASAELIYKHELVVQGKAATAALADLFDVISSINIEKTDIPVVQVNAVENGYGYGMVPMFEIQGVAPRPAGFGEPLIEFE